MKMWAGHSTAGEGWREAPHCSWLRINVDQMEMFEAEFNDGVLCPMRRLRLRPGERVGIVVVRRPDPSRWDLARLSKAIRDEDTLTEADLARGSLEARRAELVPYSRRLATIAILGAVAENGHSSKSPQSSSTCKPALPSPWTSSSVQERTVDTTSVTADPLR